MSCVLQQNDELLSVNGSLNSQSSSLSRMAVYSSFMSGLATGGLL